MAVDNAALAILDPQHAGDIVGALGTVRQSETGNTLSSTSAGPAHGVDIASGRSQRLEGLVLGLMPRRAEEDHPFALIVRVGHGLVRQGCLTHPAVVHRAHAVSSYCLNGSPQPSSRAGKSMHAEICKPDLSEESYTNGQMTACVRVFPPGPTDPPASPNRRRTAPPTGQQGPLRRVPHGNPDRRASCCPAHSAR